MGKLQNRGAKKLRKRKKISNINKKVNSKMKKSWSFLQINGCS